MSAWSHVILEAFCMYQSMSQKEWVGYEVVSWEPFKTKKCKPTKNKGYIPKSCRPNWCKKNNKKRVPCFRCLNYKGKTCPFFAYTNADKKYYKMFFKEFDKLEVE